jgi:hypothetical protein
MATQGEVMTDTQDATFAVLLGAIAVLCLLVTVGVPVVSRLMLRHRLEVIRDACVDAVLTSKLPNLPSVQQFIAATESSAARPQPLSLPRVFAAYVAMMSLGIDVREMTSSPRHPELDQDERDLMGKLEDQLCDAYRSYLKWGTPMSWLLRPLVSFLGSDSPAIDVVPEEDALPAVAREAFQDAGLHASHKSLLRHIYAGR